MRDQIRAAFYTDPPIRRLLAYLVANPGEMCPVRGPDGNYSYPQGEDLLEMKPSDVVSLLDRLTEAKILDKDVLGSQVICPACKSSQVLTRLACPSCMASNLHKVEVVVHGCGYSGSGETFRSGDRAICPKCHQALDAGEYYQRQTVFKCGSCSQFVTEPAPLQECESCGKITNYTSADLRPVYAFKINGAMQQEILETCTVDVPLAELLSSKGFNVTAPAVIRGNIGTYSIDVLATRVGRTIAFHILNLGRLADVDNIIRIRAVARDLRPDESIVVAMPGLTREAKKLAQLFRLVVVQGEDIQQTLGEIEKLV